MTDNERYLKACSTWESTIRPNITDDRGPPSRDASSTLYGLFLLANEVGEELAAFQFRESERAMDIVRPTLPPGVMVLAIDMGRSRHLKKKKKREDFVRSE